MGNSSMFLESFRGRPTTLTEEVHISIIDAVPKVLIKTQIAGLVGISHQKLCYWLDRGEKDLKENNLSIYAHLFADFVRARAIEVQNLIERIRKAPDNYKALCWILEKCFREDFGEDSEELKELRALFVRILPLIGKGEKGHGREMDSKGDQTPGSSTQETACPEGEENPRKEAGEGSSLKGQNCT